MRILKLLLFSAFALELCGLGFADSSRWRFFGKDSDHSWYYYDRDSIQKPQATVVKVWVREVPMGDIEKELQGKSDTRIFTEMLYTEQVFPENRNYTQSQWVLFSDRTVKIFDVQSQTWTERLPIGPQTMVEAIWKTHFK